MKDTITTKFPIKAASVTMERSTVNNVVTASEQDGSWFRIFVGWTEELFIAQIKSKRNVSNRVLRCLKRINVSKGTILRWMIPGGKYENNS